MSKVVKIIAGAVTLAAGIFISTFTFGGGFPLVAKGLTLIGGSLVLGGISDALRKKPVSSVLASGQARQVMVRQADAPRRVIYGQVLTSGVLTYAATNGSKNEWLHMVLTLAGHEVEEIGNMYFDGVQVPYDGSGDAIGEYQGLVHIELKLGTAAQTAFSGLVASMPNDWTSDHRQRGCAAVYLRLRLDPNNPEKFPSGVPNVTFLVKGRKCYDPRLSPAASAWTSNPALCLNDYLTSTAFGVGVSYAARVNEAALIEAANICDEQVALNTSPATYEDRYALNLAFDLGADPEEIIRQIANAMAGTAVYLAGAWHIRAGAYSTPTVTLDEDDFIEPLQVVFRQSRRDLPNGVKGTHISADANYQSVDFPPATNATYLSDDQNERFWKDIALPGTLSASMAQRIAKIDLERARRQIVVTGKAKLRAYALVPGDTVQLTIGRFAWSAKTFEVQSVQLATGEQNGAPVIGVGLVLRETDANVFAWSASEQGTATLTALPSFDALRRPLLPPHGSFGGGATGAAGDAFIRQQDSREATFYVREEDSAGTAHVNIVAAPRAISEETRSPAIGQQATLASTGGSLAGDQVLYYAVCAVDSSGLLSLPSRVIAAVIPAGTDTNKVTLTGLTFDAQAATMTIFRGRSRATLAAIASGVTLAASYEDTGLDGGTAQPPDPRLRSIMMKWRRVAAVYLAAQDADTFSHVTIGLSTGSYASMAGRIVEIVRGSGSSAGINERREIVSNTGTTLTIKGVRANVSAISRTANVVTVTTSTPHGFRTGGRITVAGVTDATYNTTGALATYISATQLSYANAGADGSSGSGYTDTGWRVLPTADSVWVVHHKVSSATATTVTDAISPAPWTVDEWAGYRVRIIDGPYSMLYQERTIISNTGDTLTVDAAWDETPDTTCSFEICEAGWNFGAECEVSFAGNLATSLDGTFIPPNEAGALIEMTAQAFDGDGVPSDPAGSPVNRYCVVGRPSSGDTAAYTFTVAGILGILASAAPPLSVLASTGARNIRALVATAPTGDDIVVAIKKNAAAYATVTILAGATEGSGSGGSLADGDILTIDITQVGTTEPGRDLTVTVSQ